MSLSSVADGGTLRIVRRSPRPQEASDAARSRTTKARMIFTFKSAARAETEERINKDGQDSQDKKFLISHFRFLMCDGRPAANKSKITKQKSCASCLSLLAILLRAHKPLQH